jgi:membrane-bound metal-dependent hydrolase YbcI (DUF457 family)
MNRQIHGILSLLIMFAAVLTATLAIIRSSSVIWAALYVVGILLSSLIIVYSFCTKCPCRNTGCGHVIPGILTRLFPPRPEGLYTFMDLAGVAIPLVFLIVFPQYWLLSNPPLFILFAVLCLIAAADIQFFVCKGCTNRFCPFCQEGCEK